MATPVEAERYIRFQLEHLTTRNAHHEFEQICYRIAKRRLSSNVVLASGPVGAGGDQGRDIESYYTRLPEELPGAGGFVGRATTEPLVVACSVQRSGLEAKIRADLKSICSQGAPVERVAFFTVQDMPTSVRHHLQDQARERHGIDLEIFDGEQTSHFLAESDLVWVAERYLDLPAHLVPDSPNSPQPDWYRQTLTALRERDSARLTLGTFAEVRNGLRRATYEGEARVDLPEWLDYMREFVGSPESELATRARYECAVATLRGRNTLDGVEDDMRAVLDRALTSESPSLLADASVLLMYWGGGWTRSLGAVTAEELRERNLALRDHIASLLDVTNSRTHPLRAARLHAVASRLCLQPRWPELDRAAAREPDAAPEIDLVQQPSDEADEQSPTTLADLPMDVAEGLEHLEHVVDLLPQAPLFDIGTVSDTFQVLAPALARDPRYPKIRDALDAAVADVEGDSAVAARSRARAVAFRREGRLLDALRELHQAKITWFHGDTIRGSLLAMRLISLIYAELRLPHAAKQYAVATVFIATNSDDPALSDLVPEALTDAMDRCYAAGAWADALAFAAIAVVAHHHLAENAFDYEQHRSLQRIDFDAATSMLAAERFRPDALPVLRDALGSTGYEQQLSDIIDTARPSFTATESTFAAQIQEQLSGPAFSDFGPRRTITFAALGTSWHITCANERLAVLAAERFAAAAQILIVELAPGDPVFLPEEVRIELLVGTPLGDEGPVRVKPDNHRVDCTVVLTPYTHEVDAKALNIELAGALVYLISLLSARPQNEFMQTVEQAFAAGLLHKLHVARPYDEIADLLDDAHYDAAAQTTVTTVPDSYQPTAHPELSFPSAPGPSYDRDASLANVRENYDFLPNLIPKTLARALADPETVAGLRELRAEGWLDWHLLIAITNVAMNRRFEAAGLLDHPHHDRARYAELAHQPETEQSEPVPLDELTPDALRQMMFLTALSIAQKRWKLLSPTQTPNSAAFQDLLGARYGFRDDVPHRDLLTEALDANGALRPLVDHQP